MHAQFSLSLSLRDSETKIQPEFIFKTRIRLLNTNKNPQQRILDLEMGRENRDNLRDRKRDIVIEIEIVVGRVSETILIEILI